MTKFEKRVDFSGYIFRSADFTESVFSEEADMEGAFFLGDANFNGSIFSNDVEFSHVNFIKKAKFMRTKFEGGAHFGGANFRDSIFHDESKFTDSELKTPTYFKGCVFKNQPPQFLGAKLHDATVWHDVFWPDPPKDERRAANFANAYERLKLEMDRLKKHEDELMFFGKEMECRRVVKGRILGLPIATYGLLCSYGQSYLRPLIWLVALFDGGAPFLYYLQPDLGFSKAVGLSAVNCLAGFGLRKELMGKTVETLNTGTLIASGVQIVLGLVLLFLIGLGLRNRFRMK